MAARRVEVAVAQGPFESWLVRGLLESYGIATWLSSTVDHSVWPVIFDEGGRVGLLVAAEDAALAEELLARHRRSGMVVVPSSAAEAVSDELE